MVVRSEDVGFSSESKGLQESAGENEALKPKGNFQPSPHLLAERARRDLIALRVKHGADTPIGHRCSNLIELLQVPELPKALVRRQMADLARLTGSGI